MPVALTDLQRLTLQASYYLDRGLTHTEIGQRLIAAFGWLTEAGAQSAINEALQMQARTVGLSLADASETVGSAVGQPDRDASFIVDVLVTTRGQSGAERTISYRVNDIDGEMSLDEFRQRIEEQSVAEMSEYFGEEVAVSWTLNFIM